jgi:flagellar assembly protein FliH
MSDFQPLFTAPLENAEFIPLEGISSSGFEPMDFTLRGAGAGEFKPTTVQTVPGAGEERTDGEFAADGREEAEASEAGGVSSEDSSSNGDRGSESAMTDDGTEAQTPGQESHEAEDEELGLEDATPSEPEIDPAIRAIEAAAQKAGFDAGMMRGKAVIAERLKEVEDILAQVEGLRAEFFARAVHDVGRTVTRVAEQVIRRELSVSSGDIEGLVRGILSDVQSDDNFVIRVSADDAEILREVQPSLLELVGRDAALRIEVDSRLLSGGALIETSFGKIDASIEQQLEAFEAGVEAWVTTEVEASDD